MHTAAQLTQDQVWSWLAAVPDPDFMRMLQRELISLRRLLSEK